MHRPFLALASLCLAICAVPVAANGPASIDDLLAPIRTKAKLPALAAAVVRSNSVIAAGAIGVRKAGSDIKVTLDDKFHIGSITKPMTATLAAMLMEEGKLSWSTTVREAFPMWKEQIHPDYAGVTIEQLLGHRAGLPGDLLKYDGGKVWQRVWSRNSKPGMEQRTLLVKELLQESPELRPGTEYRYANSGYSVVGLFMEQTEGKPWETLITERLFRPLGMTTAGFGAPAKPNEIDQPWGHVMRRGEVHPVPPGPNADNPAAIGPGGTVHCSVLDLAKFVRFHLQGARAAATLLKADTFKQLHRPLAGQTYALGWMTGTRKWAKGKILNHNGTNTMNYAVVWIAPEIDFAVIVVTNMGGDGADKACDDAAAALIAQFAK